MKAINLKSKWLMIIMATFMVINVTNYYAVTTVKAQVDFDLRDLEDEASDTSDAIVNIVKYIMTGVLALGLIVMIYKVITSDPRSREWVIGWFLGAVIYVVAMKLLGV